MSESPDDEIKIWILSYIAIRQFEVDEHSYNTHATVDANRLAKIMPKSILTHINNQDDIIKNLYELASAGLLQHFRGQSDDATFTITTNGIIVFRKYLSPIATSFDQRDYDKIIDHTEGKNAVKDELKTLKKKLKDKTEDEIIDAFIRLGIRYGSEAILFFMKLVEASG